MSIQPNFKNTKEVSFTNFPLQVKITFINGVINNILIWKSPMFMITINSWELKKFDDLIEMLLNAKEYIKAYKEIK